MQEIIFTSVDKFTDSLREEGIEKVALAETNEQRAHQHDDRLEIRHTVKSEILAYKAAVLYKCIVHDIEPAILAAELIEKGFDVTRKSRNIL